ncbi:hypothetical protein WDV06_36875, partial [Streptomyces racemochromogenes]
MNRRLRLSLSTLALTAVAATGTVTATTGPAYALLPNRSCGTITDADAAVAAQLNQQLTGSLAHAMTAYRVSCARAVVTTVRGLGLPERAAVIAVTTAIVESTLENNPNVLDHTSVGLFQQQDFWGSTQQRLDPAWSTTAFINAMQRTYPGGSWQSQDIGTVCQNVQRSAYPDRYGQQAADGQRIVAALGVPAPTPAPAASGPTAATLYNPDTATAEAFAVNADGIMVHAYNTKGGPGWTPWESLDNSFRFTGSPTAVYNPV